MLSYARASPVHFSSNLEMDEILIDLVRDHEVIYNHGSPDYRDQTVRQAAWEEIGRELEMPGNKAKERWDNLRRCFWNARSRRRDETRNGMPAKKKTPWKYEHQMAFIIPFLESRKTQNNLNESQSPVNLAITLKDPLEESEAEENSEEEHVHFETNREDVIQDNRAAEDEASFNETERRYALLQNNKQRQQIASPAYQFLRKYSTLRTHPYDARSLSPQVSTTGLSETLDDTDMFFLSMSRMTKQLPKVEQAQIKLALSNSVLSAEVRHSRQISLSPSSPPPSMQSSFSQSVLDYSR